MVRSIRLAVVGWIVLGVATAAFGQRVRFSETDPPLVPIVRVAQGPGAALNGTIQPNPGAGGFDPYADPLLQSPSLIPGTSNFPAQPNYGVPNYTAPNYAAPLYPNSTYTTGPQASSPNGSYLFVQPNGQVAYLPRLMQNARGRYTWINGNGSSDVEWNTVDAEATLLVPFFHAAAPLMVTPGGAINFVSGPASPTADLPPQLYDLFLDVGWRPQIAQRLSADLGARAGFYSDFQNTSSQALRYQGRAFLVFQYSPTVEVRGGVVYLDRIQVGLWPAGGVVWTPDDNRRFEFLFPNPKFAWRWTQYGTADIWFYLAGEYGGGSWAIDRTGGAKDQVDYNDIRAIVGLEWSTPRGLKGMVEVGYVWNRELVYLSGTGNTNLDDTFMVRGGITF